MAAASSSASFPTSLQLRSTLRSLNPSPSALRLRLLLPPPLHSPLRLFPLPLPPHASTSSSNSPDSFSGWERDNNADNAKGPGGNILGPVIAGTLFFATIAFAAFSFTAPKRSELQLQPLTSHPAASIPSDDDDGPHSHLSTTTLFTQEQEEDSSLLTISEDSSLKTNSQSDSSPQTNSDSSEINTLHPRSDASPDTFDAPPAALTPEQQQDEPLVLNDEPQTIIPDSGNTILKQEQDEPLVLNDEPQTIIPDEDKTILKQEQDEPLVLDDEPQTIIPDSDESILNLPEDDSNDSNPQEINAPLTADSEEPSQVVILQTGDVVETPHVTEDALSLDQHDMLATFNELESLQETEPIATKEETAGHNVLDDKAEANSENTDGFFSRGGIPAPTLLSAALQVPPGNVLVPPVVDQSQHQAFAALQALKVIEGPATPGELCTRREYARWLVAASSLSRNTVSKVYPAMYIENVTELAFDDITPDDPDFSCIQGLAEAGLISSKLSIPGFGITDNEDQDKILFYPESPLSRQDLVSWKMALEKRNLPEIDKNAFLKASGYIDVDKINPDAWPALVADLAAGEQSITALAFGYTRLFQSGKPVTKGQAAIALSSGESYETVNEELARIEAEALAESAVNAHTALVAQVEKEINAAYEKDLAKEREKVETLEKLAEEARLELKRLKEEREEEDNTIAMGRAAVESEMEVLLKLKHEMEKELEGVLSKKMEVSFERERISRLRQEIENENQSITQLKYDLEVERKALAMARTWAEEEAKRAREQARTLEEARSRWEQRGIKVVVDEELQDDTSAGISWLGAGEEKGVSVQEKIKAKIKTLEAVIAQKRVEMVAAFERLREKILSLIVLLKGAMKEAAAESSKRGGELWVGVNEKAKRVVEDCKEGVEKITQKLKS